jgi:transcription elongation factor GreB
MSQSNSRIVKPSPYITPAGYKRLTDEYESLWSKRKEVTRALSAAAAEGDRSENAEYIYRKKELRALDHRIRYLQKRLPVLNIVTEINNTRQIYFGAKIVLQDSSGKQITVKIAGPDELDDNDIHISVDSPLARALLNRTFNEEISYQIDRKKISYKIIDITYEKS